MAGGRGPSGRRDPAGAEADARSSDPSKGLSADDAEKVIASKSATTPGQLENPGANQQAQAERDKAIAIAAGRVAAAKAAAAAAKLETERAAAAALAKSVRSRSGSVSPPPPPPPPQVLSGAGAAARGTRAEVSPMASARPAHATGIGFPSVSLPVRAGRGVSDEGGASRARRSRRRAASSGWVSDEGGAPRAGARRAAASGDRWSGSGDESDSGDAFGRDRNRSADAGPRRDAFVPPRRPAAATRRYPAGFGNFQVIKLAGRGQDANSFKIQGLNSEAKEWIVENQSGSSIQVQSGSGLTSTMTRENIIADGFTSLSGGDKKDAELVRLMSNVKTWLVNNPGKPINFFGDKTHAIVGAAYVEFLKDQKIIKDDITVTFNNTSLSAQGISEQEIAVAKTDNFGDEVGKFYTKDVTSCLQLNAGIVALKGAVGPPASTLPVARM